MKKAPLIGIGAAALTAFSTALILCGKALRSKKTESTFGTDRSKPVKKEKKPFVDYKDEAHLIFCDESDLAHRLIQLESTINMRDIGGYTGLDGRKVKWGKVIRSEDLSRISDNDLQWLADKGVQHVYDFRDEKAAGKHPDRLPATADYTNLPVLTGLTVHPNQDTFFQPNGINDFFAQVYLFQVKEKAQSFATVLKALAKDETPILYHCTNGKDRTGFMTALILLICGVPEETIISDYSLTNLTYDVAFDTFGGDMAKDFGVPDKMLMRDFFGVNPEWIKLQLKYIRDNYGNVDDYLLSNTDLTKDDLDQIRENLLEEKA